MVEIGLRAAGVHLLEPGEEAQVLVVCVLRVQRVELTGIDRIVGIGLEPLEALQREPIAVARHPGEGIHDRDAVSRVRCNLVHFLVRRARAHDQARVRPLAATAPGLWIEAAALIRER
ncbi:MAG: hypothetical protein U1E76_08220 [Planctomycetota bacterium]